MSPPKKGASAVNVEIPNEVDESIQPDFIYGGPFIKVEKPSPFINTATPINLQLQGTFKKSFAYYSLKERLPVILTKVIDYLSRDASNIKSKNKASDEDISSLIQYITKLKYDLVTNKKYDLFTVDTPEAKRWNEWIGSVDSPNYFTNTWVFSECYVYRRLREGCELTKGLQDFDPFDDQKAKALESSMGSMCIVADRLVAMLPSSDKDKRKADLISLLKICLWANKCDLSLSGGDQVTLDNKERTNTTSNTAVSIVDPFQMIVDLKDKVLVDDSNKFCDQLVAKAEAMAKAIAGEPEDKSGAEKKGAPPSNQPDPNQQPDGAQEELPKIPCPAKVTIPEAVIFDIVCDNAGYELFSDLCLANFLISQGIVQKVRFHVKKIPWFVSDVTPTDFKYVIEKCRTSSFSKELPPESKPEAKEGEAPAEAAPRVVNASNLNSLAETWSKYVEEGLFVVKCDDFWTSPHVFCDMKKYDYYLYRDLQFATAILFKGDLNYRKLLGERNCNSTLGFEAALQGFYPAPLLAVRTVKADLICGLPKGRADQLSKLDEKWMEKGDYGVIQYSGKVEPLKPSDRPCPQYGDECRGVVCSSS